MTVCSSRTEPGLPVVIESRLTPTQWRRYQRILHSIDLTNPALASVLETGRKDASTTAAIRAFQTYFNDERARLASRYSDPSDSYMSSWLPRGTIAVDGKMGPCTAAALENYSDDRRPPIPGSPPASESPAAVAPVVSEPVLTTDPATGATVSTVVETNPATGGTSTLATTTTPSGQTTTSVVETAGTGKDFGPLASQSNTTAILIGVAAVVAVVAFVAYQSSSRPGSSSRRRAY